MSEYHVLKDLAIIFAVSLLVILVFHRIKLPALPGFIVAGVLLGPNALGLVSDVHQVESLAEVGVILLLFTIGIEFSLSRLREVGRQVVIGGGAQVLLTGGLGAGVAAATAAAWVACGARECGRGVVPVRGGPGRRAPRARRRSGGGVARARRVPGGARDLGVRLRAPGHGRAAAVPRRLHLVVFRDRGDAGAGGLPARSPRAGARRRGGHHGRQERARRARTGGAGLLGTRGPARRPRRVPDRRVLVRAGATGSGRGDPSRGPVSDVPRGGRAHDAGDAVRSEERRCRERG